MRMFWYQGGLRVEPEAETERKLLTDLMASLKLEEPPEMAFTTPGGSCELSDSDLELLTCEQRGPGRLSGQPSNKQPVVCALDHP